MRWRMRRCVCAWTNTSGGSLSVLIPCSADLPVPEPEGEVAVPPAQEVGEARLDGTVPQGAQEGGPLGKRVNVVKPVDGFASLATSPSCFSAATWSSSAMMLDNIAVAVLDLNWDFNSSSDVSACFLVYRTKSRRWPARSGGATPVCRTAASPAPLWRCVL